MKMKRTKEIESYGSQDPDFESTIERIASMSITEIHAELRRFGLHPTEVLPEQLKRLVSKPAKSSRTERLRLQHLMRYLGAQLVEPTWRLNSVRVVLCLILFGFFALFPFDSTKTVNRGKAGETLVGIDGKAPPINVAQAPVKVEAPTTPTSIDSQLKPQIFPNNHDFLRLLRLARNNLGAQVFDGTDKVKTSIATASSKQSLDRNRGIWTVPMSDEGPLTYGIWGLFRADDGSKLQTGGFKSASIFIPTGAKVVLPLFCQTCRPTDRLTFYRTGQPLVAFRFFGGLAQSDIGPSVGSPVGNVLPGIVLASQQLPCTALTSNCRPGSPVALDSAVVQRDLPIELTYLSDAPFVGRLYREFDYSRLVGGAEIRLSGQNIPLSDSIDPFYRWLDDQATDANQFEQFQKGVAAANLDDKQVLPNTELRFTQYVGEYAPNARSDPKRWSAFGLWYCIAPNDQHLGRSETAKSDTQVFQTDEVNGRDRNISVVPDTPKDPVTITASDPAVPRFATFFHRYRKVEL